MTNEDRIQQEADMFCKQRLKDGFSTRIDGQNTAFIAGAIVEYAHWQPIISEKDAAIKELVEGLEKANRLLSNDNTLDKENGIITEVFELNKYLINKYKKQ